MEKVWSRSVADFAKLLGVGAEASLSAARTGVLLGSLSQFVSILGASLTFPFLQSQRDLLQCNAMCYGSMQSARSALNLVGSVLVGRMSDKLGRIPVMLVGILSSLLSYGINYANPSIAAMWVSMLPSALNQNWSVLKALFADYSAQEGGDEKKRAVDVGRLGMAVGISFMVSVSCGPHCAYNWRRRLTPLPPPLPSPLPPLRSAPSSAQPS